MVNSSKYNIIIIHNIVIIITEMCDMTSDYYNG